MTPEERLREIAIYCETPLEHGIGLVSASTIFKMATSHLTEEQPDELSDPANEQRQSDHRPDRAGDYRADPGDYLHGDRPLAAVATGRTPRADHPWRQYQTTPQGSRSNRVTAAPRTFNPVRERLDLRTTPAMRTQLNAMMRYYNVNVSEAIRRAIEYWWRHDGPRG